MSKIAKEDSSFQKTIKDLHLTPAEARELQIDSNLIASIIGKGDTNDKLRKNKSSL